MPVLVLTLSLTVAANEFLGIDPFLKIVSAIAIVFMTLALVGLATGLGARYPRFNAENPTQIAGSYGGVSFMVLAVLFIILVIALLGWPTIMYLMSRRQWRTMAPHLTLLMAGCYSAVVLLSLTTWLAGMRSGVRALQQMDRTPS